MVVDDVGMGGDAPSVGSEVAAATYGHLKKTDSTLLNPGHARLAERDHPGKGAVATPNHGQASGKEDVDEPESPPVEEPAAVAPVEVTMKAQTSAPSASHPQSAKNNSASKPASVKNNNASKPQSVSAPQSKPQSAKNNNGK